MPKRPFNNSLPPGAVKKGSIRTGNDKFLPSRHLGRLQTPYRGARSVCRLFSKPTLRWPKAETLIWFPEENIIDPAPAEVDEQSAHALFGFR